MERNHAKQERKKLNHIFKKFSQKKISKPFVIAYF